MRARLAEWFWRRAYRACPLWYNVGGWRQRVYFHIAAELRWWEEMNAERIPAEMLEAGE